MGSHTGTGTGWPGGHDEGDGGNESRPQSGALGCAGQITSSLDARLIRRFSQPLGEPLGEPLADSGQGSQGAISGDTDEIEQLPPGHARMLREYRARGIPAVPPLTQHAPLPPLPPLPDLSMPHAPRPMRRPTPQPSLIVAGGMRQSAAPVGVMTAPPTMPYMTPATPYMQAPLYPPLDVPVSITALLARDYHMGVAEGAYTLPQNVLAYLDTRDKRLWLAPQLVPGVSGSMCGYTSQLERIIESRHVVRYVLAALWVRARMGVGNMEAHALPDDTPPARAFVAAFAPASGLTGYSWRRWHGGYYTALYHRTNRLVADKAALDRLTAIYLGLPPHNPYALPHLGPERMRAVRDRALVIQPGLRAECGNDAAAFARLAWQYYLMYVARNLNVPRCVVADRLHSDVRQIASADDLCAWTDDLLKASPEGGEWRAATARAWGLMGDTRRDGSYISPAQRVALWIAEPASTVAYQHPAAGQRVG